MRGTILLNRSEDTHKVEEEEKARFLLGVLRQCFENTDVAEQICSIWNTDGPLPPDKKVKLRGVLSTYGIQVIDNSDRHMQIYLENELVGEWLKSTYKLRQDIRVMDPRQRIYLEMTINCWSVFDQQEEQET